MYKMKIKGFLQVLTSVLAAICGVRHSKYSKRDFASKSAVPFIVTGILVVVALVFLLVLLVQFIIAKAV